MTNHQIDVHRLDMQPGEGGWAAWQPVISQVGRLARQPSGPPRQLLKQVNCLYRA